MLKFVKGERAVFIEEISTAVIRELHLGIEHELYEKGITIPPQRIEFVKRIKDIVKSTKAKKLVILGDVKHQVPWRSLREEYEIPRFLEEVSEFVEIEIAKGNHDGKIEELVPENVKIHGPQGFSIESYGFFHGHAWPSRKLLSCDFLFMAHLHPSFEFEIGFGLKSVEEVWIKTKLLKENVKKKYGVHPKGKLDLIIVPAFNKLLGGANVKKIISEGSNPLMKRKIIDIKSIEIFLLDGTPLGNVV